MHAELIRHFFTLLKLVKSLGNHVHIQFSENIGFLAITLTEYRVYPSTLSYVKLPQYSVSRQFDYLGFWGKEIS